MNAVMRRNYCLLPMDASAIQDYFAPLNAYLDTQVQGLACGY